MIQRRLSIAFLPHFRRGSTRSYPHFDRDPVSVYSLAANGQRVSETQSALLDSLGYVSGPGRRTLYFSEGRGSEEFNGYGLVDLSFRHSIPVWESLSPWFKLAIYNVLNNDAVISTNTSVVPDPDSPLDELGLPTGYIKGPNFGEPTSPDNYPQWQPGLRTILASMGFTF